MSMLRRVLRKPIFVVGLGRSGTTVLLRGLALHPRVLAIWSESPFIHLIGGLVHEVEAGDHARYVQQTMNVNLDHVHARLQSLCFESVFGSPVGLKPSPRRLAKLLPTPFMVTRWAARTYPDERQYRGLNLLYPHARFVYIIRNGCEVVESRSRYHAFRQRGFLHHCRTWVEHIDRYAHLETEDRAFVIRHEQLVLDPEGVLTACFAFLGLKPSARSAAFLSSTFIHPLDQETKEGVDVRRALQGRAPAHEGWSYEEKAVFKDECGEAMQRLGYEIPF